jgi:hypothetical protein
VNLAHGCQLVSYDDKALQDICTRSVQVKTKDGEELEEQDVEKEEDPVGDASAVKLMSQEDLTDWQEWFSSATPEEEAIRALLDVEYDRLGREIRKSRSKASLSEANLWEQVAPRHSSL